MVAEGQARQAGLPVPSAADSSFTGPTTGTTGTHGATGTHGLAHGTHTGATTGQHYGATGAQTGGANY